MIKELIALANNLDSKGFSKEADVLDKIIKEAGVYQDYDAKTLEIREIVANAIDQSLSSATKEYRETLDRWRLGNKDTLPNFETYIKNAVLDIIKHSPGVDIDPRTLDHILSRGVSSLNAW